LLNCINIYGFFENPEDSCRKIIKENKLKYQNPLFPETEGGYF
jgi:hypothetical protein